MWTIKNKHTHTNKINAKTKQKHTHKYREQSSGYQRKGQGGMGKGDQLYGDRWKLNF